MTSVAKTPNFPFNDKIKRSKTSCSGSRSTTAKSSVSSGTRTTAIKRAQYLFNTKREIERWAYNEDKNTDDVGYESDEIKSIDDSYLDKMVERDFDDFVREKRYVDAQRRNISKILKTVRDNKQLAIDMSKKDPCFIASDLKGYAIQDMTIGKENIEKPKTLQPKNNRPEKSARSAKLSDASKTNFNSSFNIKAYEALSTNLNQLSEQAEKIEKKPVNVQATKDTAIKYKKSCSGMSRAMPGKIQQNITLERTFFKDLLKLSRERYLTRINSDYQKRKFTDSQTKKGLCDERGGSTRSRTSLPTRKYSVNTKKSSSKTPFTSPTPSMSNNDQMPSYDYKTRCASAYVKRHNSTPMSRPIQSPNQPLQDPIVTETSEIDAIKQDRANFFKSSTSCGSRLSFRSGVSSIGSTVNMKNKQFISKSQVSNESTDMVYESASRIDRDKKIRSKSAYERRKMDANVQENINKLEREMISANLPSPENDDANLKTALAIKTVENINLAPKPNLKRPNTSIAYQRTGFSKKDQYSIEKASTVKIPIDSRRSSEADEEEANPVADNRYKTLLGTMTSVYVPKKSNTQNVNERVKHLISGNTALQSFDGVEKERKTRHEINSNMKLFEKLIRNYF